MVTVEKKTFHEIVEKSKLMIKPALMMSLVFLAQSLIVTTDVLMIGWLGVEQLAASGFVVRLYMPCFLFALGLVLPITPLGGEARGARKSYQVRRIVQQSLWISGLVGIALTIVLQNVLQPFLIWIDQPQDIINYATEYGQIFLWSVPLITMGTGLRAFMNVAGRSAPFMYVGFLMVLLNAILDYVFIFGCFGIDAMGVVGAAIATIIVNVSYLLIIIFIVIKMKPYRKYRIFKKIKKLKLHIILKISNIGLPMSLRMITETLLISFYYISMSKFGVNYLAGYQVVFQLNTMAFLISIGIAVSITANVGHAKGEKDARAMLVSSLSGILLMSILLTAFGGVLYLSSDFIGNMFILGDSISAQKTRYIINNMIIIVASYQLFHALYFSLLSAIDGMGEVRLSSIAFLTIVLLSGVGFTIILSGTYLEAYGIVLASVISYSLTIIPLAIIFVYKTKQYFLRYK